MGTKNVKLDIGTVYQKTEGGNYFFRYQVDGQRKAVSLKTRNRKEAIAKAEEMVPLLRASSVEVVAAHVSHARNWSKKEKRLELAKAWSVYDCHPDRAHPATVNIYQRYRACFQDFVAWATGRGLAFLDEVGDDRVAEYATDLRTREIGVDTHNKAVRRVGHVFRTLKEYTREDTSDLRNPSFRRKPREEVGITARRLPFTKEQEERLFAMLADPARVCKNKAELRVMFHLGAFTGQRMKDCVLLQWHNVDLERQRIGIAQFKTGKEVAFPIAPQLLVVLREAEGWRRDSYVLPNLAERYLRKDAEGKNTGPVLVNADAMRVIHWLGMESCAKVPGRAKAVTVYGFHSLRHSFVSFCIDHNIPRAVAVSILGADAEIIDQYYTHIGDDAQEQAIQLISGNGTSMKQRYERALEYLGGISEKGPELQELERILKG